MIKVYQVSQDINSNLYVEHLDEFLTTPSNYYYFSLEELTFYLNNNIDILKWKKDENLLNHLKGYGKINILFECENITELCNIKETNPELFI